MRLQKYKTFLPEQNTNGIKSSRRQTSIVQKAQTISKYFYNKS